MQAVTTIGFDMAKSVFFKFTGSHSDTNRIRCRAAVGHNSATQTMAHRDLTAWLGMSDSNSGIRARAMYLRYRDNSCWLGQKSPAETIPV
jgi:hypothetical protein